MKINTYWILVPIMGSLFLSGCKSKQESLGDEFLQKGKLSNAIAMYTKAEQKGGVSETFYDNFSLAYLRQAEKTAKHDPMSTVVSAYLEQIAKYMKDSKDPKVIEEYITTLARIGEIQATTEDIDYEFILQGFNNLKHAEEVSAQNGKVGASAIQASRNAMESKYIGAVLKNAADIENTVAREYEYLLAEVVAPNNADLKAALNEVRKKNRGDFLIFEAAGVENPSRWVNKYGYVIAFPSIALTSSGLKGELQLWNSSGNNTEFDTKTIKLVSTDGKEVVNKAAGSGWCSGADTMKPTKEKLVNGKGKSLNEGTCSVMVEFSFEKGFVPDYVEYKDNFGTGRKYLGQ
ncbi:MAG TPA: hypothetical protein VLM37_12130 [Fibrobacteraceae bacterium]|nr:hypothetical protein [Fibrobacteraceae bacterium]